MLDMQNDWRAGFQKEDIVGIAAGQSPCPDQTIQPVALLGGPR
jgi:hypothetical protein